MKANLPKNEPKMLEHWEKMRIYDRIRGVHKGQPIYVMHDGPPYASRPIHLGTALNKTLHKDFVVKSRSMSGFDAPTCPVGTATGCRSRSRSTISSAVRS